MYSRFGLVDAAATPVAGASMPATPTFPQNAIFTGRAERFRSASLPGFRRPGNAVAGLWPEASGNTAGPVYC